MEKLGIKSAPFKVLREQFDDTLQSIIKQISGSDEAELQVKIKIRKGYASDDTDELDLSWDITKTIKAKKFKVSGWPEEKPIIRIGDDGKVEVFENQQISLFDEDSEEVELE